MRNAVMISIRPKWCVPVAQLLKLIEVRKSRPRIEAPFKCYIYCTKAKDVSFWTGPRYSYADDHSHNTFDRCGNGKVIGEFICNKIDRYTDDVVNASSTEDYSGWNDFELEKACIHPDDLEKYADGNDLYGWHISDLVIYDKPKELSEFKNRQLVWRGNNHIHTFETMKRPPQSWCYVEELEVAVA